MLLLDFDLRLRNDNDLLLLLLLLLGLGAFLLQQQFLDLAAFHLLHLGFRRLFLLLLFLFQEQQLLLLLQHRCQLSGLVDGLSDNDHLRSHFPLHGRLRQLSVYLTRDHRQLVLLDLLQLLLLELLLKLLL